MLLGCCHCGSESLPPSDSQPSESMPPSESTPPSESILLPSESSGIESIAEPWNCSNCDIMPNRWVISGVNPAKWVFNPLFTDYLDCQAIFENGLVLSNPIHTAFTSLPTNGMTCTTWKSAKRVINYGRYYQNPFPGGLHSPTCRESNYIDNSNQDARWILILKRVNPLSANQVRFQLSLRTGKDANQTQSGNIGVGEWVFTKDFTVASHNCVRSFTFTDGVDGTSGAYTFTTSGHAITISPG